MRKPRPKSVDEYIERFPTEIQVILQGLRHTIMKAAPEAEEIISYQIPAFRLNGNLVYFAAFKNHIGFYPTASGIRAFEKELSQFDGSTGTVRFPIGKPLPLPLVSRIVKFRVKENLTKARRK